MKKLIRSAVVPDYEKIRRFVIGEVARAGNVPMRLASNREIAGQFGVSHPTVLKALRDLVTDGYLTVKPGSLGTFTNPGRFACAGDVKLIGLLRFDGKTVFESRFTCEFVHAFSRTLLRKSSKYMLENCFLAGERSEADNELGGLNLDAIAWFFPSSSTTAALVKLKERGMITVFSSDTYDPDAAVYFDHAAINYQVARRLLAEGRRRVMLVLPKCAAFGHDAIAGVQKAFAESDLQFDLDAVTIDGATDFEEKIRRLKPDGLIFNHDPIQVWTLVRKHLEIETACRVYAPELLIHEDMDFTGLVGIADAAAAGRRMAEQLVAKFDGRPVPPPVPIEVKIVAPNRAEGEK